MRVYERVAILGGADPGDPLDPNNRMRHVAVGGLLICVAVWACVAATGMFHSNLRVRWPLALGGGALLATIIFCIDLLITCTPLKRDTFGHRARIILIRGMFSLAVGLIIAHASILFIYHDALEAIVSHTNQIAAQKDTQSIQASSVLPSAITAAQKQIYYNQSEIKTDNSLFVKAQNQLNNSKIAWLNDRLCVHGSLAADGNQCGPGPVSDTLRNSYQELAANFPAVQANHASTVASLNTAIATLNNTITTDRNELRKQIQTGVQADLANTGLAAQSEALWELLRQNAFLWLWPVFFFIIDLTVALMKGILPESDFDLKRRRNRDHENMLESDIEKSSVWREVAEHTADCRARVAMARADDSAAREIAALQSQQAPSTSQPSRSTPQPAARRRLSLPRTGWLRKLALISLPGSLALTLAITLNASSTQGSGRSADVELSAVGGHSITLQGGEKLTIPIGAVTGNAPVTATYITGQAWPGNTPSSPEVKFATTGKLIGKPILSLHVPSSERPIALTGALHVAFESSDNEWTTYPATYDAEADAMVATLTHFSTWRFWTLTWATEITK